MMLMLDRLIDGGLCVQCRRIERSLPVSMPVLITRKPGLAAITTIVVISTVITSMLPDHCGLHGFELPSAAWLRRIRAALSVIGVILGAVL